MGSFDQFEPVRSKRRNSGRDGIWNMLSGAMLILTLCLGGYFMSLFSNPHSRLNPFPPPTRIPTLPPATATPLGLPPTWTPTPTIQPTVTPTPRPSITVVPTSTTFVLPSSTSRVTATKTPKGGATAKPTGAPYVATITPYESTVFRADTSCSWAGVAGQVYDKNNNPMIGLQVKLGGFWNNKTVDLTMLSGISSAYYGPSGFEFYLGDQPLASTKLLWIQLFDQTGAPLSDQIYFDTYADCKKNLIFVRFKGK